MVGQGWDDMGPSIDIRCAVHGRSLPSQRLAICRANVPTPPHARLIRTFCPGCPPSRSAWRAASAEVGTAAGSSNVRLAGFSASLREKCPCAIPLGTCPACPRLVPPSVHNDHRHFGVCGSGASASIKRRRERQDGNLTVLGGKKKAPRTMDGPMSSHPCPTIVPSQDQCLSDGGSDTGNVHLWKAAD